MLLNWMYEAHCLLKFPQHWTEELTVLLLLKCLKISIISEDLNIWTQCYSAASGSGHFAITERTMDSEVYQDIFSWKSRIAGYDLNSIEWECCKKTMTQITQANQVKKG